jgi:uncharacterized protein YcaQ
LATISLKQARHALLAAQGLTSPPPASAGRDDVLAAIKRMHALQIDTISVVARSPYLVLWSRIGDYEPDLLDDLLTDRKLFEHWSHAACFLNIEDYPIYRRMMLDQHVHWLARYKSWFKVNDELVERVLDHVRQTGPVRSADFERPEGRKGAGWWDWKEEKVALEMLNTRGDLLVSSRQNFQRIYDLRERVHPEWDDSLAPSSEDARRELTLRGVKTLGVARAEWVKDNFRSLTLGAAPNRKRLEELANSGDLVSVEVEGWTAPAYIHPDNMHLLEGGAEDRPPLTTLLSPFDPVTRDRARALDLFGFDYRIECYTPAPQRKYGYFTLPILHGDALVGRLDPKAHRKQGIFEVKSIHLEPDVEVTADLVDGLRDTLQRIAAWHKTPEVVVGETNPRSLAWALAPPKRRSRGAPKPRDL